MASYVVSLLMGIAAGAAYGLVQVRSPAPPLIALVGLLGMVLGEQTINVARLHFAPAPASIGQMEDSLRRLSPTEHRNGNIELRNDEHERPQ